MISIDVTHPDLEEFIGLKNEMGKIEKANISVKVTDEFMQAVKAKKKFMTSFVVEDTGQVIEKEVDAYEVFMKLVEMNWDWAEPGILFWDNISNYNLLNTNTEFEYAGTNPCAEEPLPAGGSCLLGSIILPTLVTDGGTFDFERFGRVIRESVRALDEVLDEGLPLHPLKEQRETVANWRQIGLGVLGVGDVLIKLGMTYGSDRAANFCDEIGRIMAQVAIDESSKLAEENGAYPMYDDRVLDSSFYAEHIATGSDTDKRVRKSGLRHSQLLTIAPTGSIGTMLECSTGIEPNFAFSYMRTTKTLHDEGDVKYEVNTRIVQEYLIEHDIDTADNLPEYFVASKDITPVERVKMQAAWQRHIDASISSTVNLPNSATKEDVYDVYMSAWEQGLKGATVYRAGCQREGILVEVPKEKAITKDELADIIPKDELARGVLKDTAEDTLYYPRTIHIGCGKIKLMVGYAMSEPGMIQDIYAIRSGQGGCEKNIQAVAIYMSGMFRLGGDITAMKNAISGISGCPSFAMKPNTSKGNNCPTAMLFAVEKFLIDRQKELHFHGGQDEDNIYNVEKLPKSLKDHGKEKEEVTPKQGQCPKCGEPLEAAGGCFSCSACGYSKCD